MIPFVIAASLWLFQRGAQRSGLPANRMLQFQMLVSAASFAGAKAFSLIFEWGWNPLDSGTSDMAGGWRYPGGLFAIVAAILVLRPRLLPEVSLARYGDLLAPAIAIGVGIARLHCVLQGCCVGDTCQQFFCVSYAPGSEVGNQHMAAGLITAGEWSARVLPLHALFMAASLTVAAVLWRFDPRRAFDGQVFLLFLVLHEGAKFALEFLREPMSQLLLLSSLVPALIGGVLLVIGSRRQALRPTSD